MDPSSPSSSGIQKPPSFGVGWSFDPTDYELVDHYLRSRIAFGDAFQPPCIPFCPDLFGGVKEPWELWRDHGRNDQWDRKEPDITLYFFTRRKRLGRNSARFNRKVGSGIWSGQYPRDVLGEEDVVIGEKREFRYEKGCDKDQNNRWFMEEYHVVGDDSDLVLCSLRRKKKCLDDGKKKMMKRKAAPSRCSDVVVVYEEKADVVVNEKKRKSDSMSVVDKGLPLDNANVNGYFSDSVFSFADVSDMPDISMSDYTCCSDVYQFENEFNDNDEFFNDSNLISSFDNWLANQPDLDRM